MCTPPVDKHVGKLLVTKITFFYSSNFFKLMCEHLLQRQYAQPHFTGSSLFLPHKERPPENEVKVSKGLLSV